MQGKRILYLLHQYFPRHIGGTEVFTSGLVARAVADGNEVSVITCHESDCSSKDQFHVESFHYQDAQVFEIHFNLSVTEEPSRYEFDNPYTAKEVVKVLDDFQPDIVHMMHPMKLTPTAMDRVTSRKIPSIVTLADFWLICPRHSLVTYEELVCSGPDKAMKCVACVSRLHGYPKKPFGFDDTWTFMKDIYNLEIRKNHMKKKILRANRIFALSNFQKRIFVENGYPEKRIEVSNHGIEVAHLAGQPHQTSNDGKVRFGFVGNITPIKGLHILVEAMAVLNDPAVELLVWGPEQNSSYFEELRLKASSIDNIKFMGAFEPPDFGRIMRTFDALLMPSLWYENDPLVAKAALFLGVPVIARQIGSLKEMVVVDKQGWLIDSESPQDWALKLRDFVAGHPHEIKASAVKSMDDTAAEMFSVYQSEIALQAK